MKAAYSILLENHPKSFYHCWILVQSLLQNAKVAPEAIFVQCVKDVPEIWRDKLVTLAVQIVPSSWEGNADYAFKAKQLSLAELADFQIVVLLDTNMLLLESIECQFSKKEIVGKIVDLPNPDISTLEKVYKAAKLSLNVKSIPSDLDPAKSTYQGNLSGGIYIIPKKVLSKLSKSWQKWTNWFNKNVEVAATINNVNQISQVAFSMAVHESKLPIKHLSRKYNCPTHLHFAADIAPVVLHHFNQFTKVGLLYNHNPAFPQFSETINRANQFIGSVFDNLPFWEFRYKFYPALGSGIGSRDEHKIDKIALLKSLNIEASETILDVGCGDLEVLADFEFKEYLGLEASTEAIKIAKAKRPDLKFQLLDASIGNLSKQYDTVICLEVLNHQKDRTAYFKLIQFLAKATKKRLIVTGYNGKKPHHDTNHMLAFHEPLPKSLVDLETFNNIRLIARYSDVQVLLAEKEGEEIKKEAVSASTAPKKKKKFFGIFGG